MKSFYEHLARGHSASLALNWAMKCLRESEKHCAVKHWAPFILIGDDVTIEFGQNQKEYFVYPLLSVDLCLITDLGKSLH